MGVTGRAQTVHGGIGGRRAVGGDVRGRDGGGGVRVEVPEQERRDLARVLAAGHVGRAVGGVRGGGHVRVRDGARGAGARRGDDAGDAEAGGVRCFL